jgi:hypothetical protein
LWPTVFRKQNLKEAPDYWKIDSWPVRLRKS